MLQKKMKNATLGGSVAAVSREVQNANLCYLLLVFIRYQTFHWILVVLCHCLHYMSDASENKRTVIWFNLTMSTSTFKIKLSSNASYEH